MKLTTQPPSVAKVKESGTIPPLPQYPLMAWCLVKKSTGTTLPLLLPYLPYNNLVKVSEGIHLPYAAQF
jgi:hypothetical protein